MGAALKQLDRLAELNGLCGHPFWVHSSALGIW